MTQTEKFLIELRTTTWSTSGARFNASRRLKRRDSIGMFSIAMFAAIGVGLSIVEKAYALHPGSQIDNYVTTLSICIGLFVIVISLIEWGSSSSLRADALYRNAEELNELQRRLAQLLAEISDGRKLEPSEVNTARADYENIKKACRFNHEPIDHQLFIADHRLSPEFLDGSGRPRTSWLRAQQIRLMSVVSIGWYFGVFWVAILILLWITAWTSV